MRYAIIIAAALVGLAGLFAVAASDGWELRTFGADTLWTKQETVEPYSRIESPYC